MESCNALFEEISAIKKHGGGVQRLPGRKLRPFAEVAFQ